MTKMKRELLRDDRNGKIAGVCAGIADYFGWELWLVRVVTISRHFACNWWFFSSVVFCTLDSVWRKNQSQKSAVAMLLQLKQSAKSK